MQTLDAYEIALKLYNEKNFSEAKRAFFYCLELDPTFFYAKLMLGNVYLEEKDYPNAIRIYKKAIKLKPEITLTYNNLASIFFLLKEDKKTLKYLKQAYQNNDTCIQTLYNLAKYYKNTLELKKSKKYLKEIIQIDSSHALAHFDLSSIYFIEKKYKKAFKNFEYRSKLKDQSHKYNYLPFTPWQGQSIKQKDLLICHEQGFGDNIQFARFLKHKQLRKKQVSYAVQNSLNKLFTCSFPHIKFLKQVHSNSNFNYTIPIMSLPYIFDMRKIKQEKKYLSVKKKDIKIFRKRHLNKQKLNIGLVWKGSQTQTADNKRSLSLSHFKNIITNKRLQCFSLQIESNEELTHYKEVVDLGKNFSDFYDTAVAIEALDLIISVDTAVAHLCGALGKSCFVLHNKQMVDFRWEHVNNNSLWYKSIRIFKYKDIDKTITNVQKEITKYYKN